MSPRRELPLILASASPRRLELMRAAGYRPRVIPSPIEEPTRRPARIAIADWPVHLALIKAQSVARGLKQKAIVIGADTIVVLNRKILGKPSSARHARAMLTALSGKRHQVITGVALLSDNACSLFSCVSECKIKKLSPAWLAAYIKSELWKGKAGAYGLQDKDDPFVTLLSGEASNVIGLPMETLAEQLRRFER